MIGRDELVGALERLKASVVEFGRIKAEAGAIAQLSWAVVFAAMILADAIRDASHERARH